MLESYRKIVTKTCVLEDRKKERREDVLPGVYWLWIPGSEGLPSSTCKLPQYKNLQMIDIQTSGAKQFPVLSKFSRNKYSNKNIYGNHSIPVSPIAIVPSEDTRQQLPGDKKPAQRKRK